MKKWAAEAPLNGTGLKLIVYNPVFISFQGWCWVSDSGSGSDVV